MTNPKLAANCAVNTVVWVKKPGPIDEVAIKKAAPSSRLQLNRFFTMLSPSPPASIVQNFRILFNPFPMPAETPAIRHLQRYSIILIKISTNLHIFC